MKLQLIIRNKDQKFMIADTPPKIAFIRVFARAPIAYRVEEMLANAFPEYEVETITITDLLKSRPDILLVNVFHTLITYGTQVGASWRNFRRSFIATPYLFKQVKRLVAHRLLAKRQDYVFSFQLQSLFDASLPELPHFVYTDHTHLANLEYEQFDQSLAHTQAWIDLERQIYQNADLVFTRSSNITRSLLNQYGCPADKVVCVYVGVNVSAPKEPGLQKDYSNKEILFVGLDWERKGGPELLEAFQQVLSVHPDAQLTIIGSEPLVNLSNCQVLGKLPLESLQPHYASASIFCLPTKLEPFGVVFVEAMANRLPIVATEIGAIPDFVINGENGYLVSPGDISGLARALIRLLDNPVQCRSFGTRSYGLVGQRYNWQIVGSKIRESVYDQIEKERVKIR
jgi:glycosyltransferase involved in cell wall biosynthesis